MPTKILNKLSLEFQKYNIKKIESGASKKIFYRLSKNNKTFIVINFSSEDNMISGANAALAIKGNIIAVSGITGDYYGGTYVQIGTGMSYSIDGDESW